MKKIEINGIHVGYESETEFECGAGIVISHGVEIFPQFRGQGLGQKAHEARLDEFKKYYNYALCTVRRDNDVQLHILKKFGWVRLANTSTPQHSGGHPIYLMGRNLK